MCNLGSVTFIEARFGCCFIVYEQSWTKYVLGGSPSQSCWQMFQREFLQRIWHGVSKSSLNGIIKTQKQNAYGKYFHFEVVATRHNTLLQTFVKLLETVGKVFFRNRFQKCRHAVLNLLDIRKPLSLRAPLKMRDQKIVSRSKIRRVGWVIQNSLCRKMLSAWPSP